MDTRRLASICGALLVGFAGLLALACSDSEQLEAVDEFTEGGYLVQLACLDTNDDGAVNAGDASPEQITDLNGDGAIDQGDADIVSAVEIPFIESKPNNCVDDPPTPDWLITEPPSVDCAAGGRAVLLYGIGGGQVDFSDRENAAGVRWMMHELGNELSDADVPNYAASVAPNVHGAENENIAAERWSAAFLTNTLEAQPCLQVVLVGHSYGAVAVKAVAAELEAAGFADRVVLTAMIDRWAQLYGGTTDTTPQQSPMLNFYLNGVEGTLPPIDQPNVENVEAAEFMAPENGEEGGELVKANHVTIDNSPDVLDLLIERVFSEMRLERAAD